jgi:hypothetical protein
MTGPEDLFGGLDDPAGAPADPPAIDTVISRGRQIRFRRYAMASGSAAVLSTAVAVAAFGVVPDIDAGRTGHQLTPAQQPSATASVTAAPHKHDGAAVLTVRPGTRRTPVPTRSPSPAPSASPADYPCATPSPTPATDPLGTAPPSPSPTDDGATPPPTCESPSPTATPTDDTSPTPAGSPSASETPAQVDVSPQA